MQAQLQQPDSRKFILLDLSDGELYKQGSIAGAVHLAYENIIIGGEQNPHKLPAPEKFAKALASIGYDGSQRLIAFDEEFGLKAARLYWTLRVAGLAAGADDFSLLNGGLAAWQEAGHEPMAGNTVAKPAEQMNIAWSGDFFADAPTIAASLPKQDFFLWDTRSYKEWTGEDVFAERGGHIPGALNLEWNSFLDDKGRVLPLDKVREMLNDFLSPVLSAGATSKPVVAYCQAHRRSSMAFLLAQYAGINVKGYDGSWAEWGNDKSLPISTPE